MQTDLSFWIGFNVFVLLMLALDLGIFNRKSHEISIKEAMIWTGVWMTLAMCFNVFIYLFLEILDYEDLHKNVNKFNGRNYQPKDIKCIIYNKLIN